MHPVSYRAGSSVVHRLDVRFKLVLLILLSVSILDAGLLHLALLIGLQVALLIHLGVSLQSIFATLRTLLILLAVIFVVRVFTTPVEPADSRQWLFVSHPGIASGARITARMLVVVLLALTVVITTRPVEIKAAVEWFLKPLPGIPSGRIGTMLGLLLRLIPLLTVQAGETMQAQRARAVENRKNPVYRLTWFAIPFLRRSFVSVDHLTTAMEARCYTDDRTGPSLTAARRDWAALAAGLTYVILVLVT